jgi:hypothetical protein
MGTAMGGGAGGQNIIDQDEVAVAKALRLDLESEGLVEVGQSLATSESGLSVGGADPFEGWQEFELKLDSQRVCNRVGLVELPLAETAGVQGYRNEKRGLKFPQAVVDVKGVVAKRAQVRAQFRPPE